MQNPVQTNTVIVGAGPAGLAIGVCLKRAGIPFLILEQADQIASSWRRHYDRLHLHTSKRFSELPFFHFPRDYPRYPSRLQVVSYLEQYARQFQLEPRCGQPVIAASPVDGLWEIETPDTRYRASNLVIATGYNREPYLPVWPGQSSFRGARLHSSEYHNGEPFKHQQVLVVGFGNSGGEIAIDLYEHGAIPSMAVRGPVNVIPRDLFGIPILAIGIAQSKLPPRVADGLNALILNAVVGDLTPYGLNKMSVGPMTQIDRDARIPLIDVGTIDLIKRGQITIYPGIDRFTEGGVVFTDGRERLFDAVILATGYRPRVNAFLKNLSGVYDAEGTPYPTGPQASIPGLYFCGYYVPATGMLREIAHEAMRISASIAQRKTQTNVTA